MEKLKDRIEYLVDKTGLSQDKFANTVDVGIGTIKGILQGKTQSIKPHNADKIAKYFGFTREWIMNGTGEKIDPLSQSWDQINSSITNTIPVNYYENIRASAGNGYINGDEYKPVTMHILKSMIPSGSKNIDAIKVDGDSMENTISSGDIIFVDKNYIDIINGNIYVIAIGDEVYVKRIFKDVSTDSIIIKSDNPLHPQFQIDPSEVIIIGKVVANINIKKL